MCISNIKFAVLVNGSPSREASLNRGLRQGMAMGEKKLVTRRWENDRPIKDLFPTLYESCRDKFATVNKFRSLDPLLSNYSKWDFNLVHLLLLFCSMCHDNLATMLSHVVFDDLVEDQVEWSVSSTGVFSVSDAIYTLIHSNGVITPTWPKVIWGNNVPTKVMLFHWIAIHNCIPVKDVLIKRHILPASQSNVCIWCLEDTETTIDLLLHCKWSFKIWAELFSWWNVSWVIPGSIEAFSFDWFFGMGIKASKYWKLIGPATIWAIWLDHNDFIFNGKFTCCSALIHNIKLKTFLWASNLNLCNGNQSHVWEHNPSLLCF
ncbi:uncharacterized protein [Rutidosis leptorrhynchoides]|uniref:uncharacterized protein n=1 Tax=Rutidosis leptorrhynchoides TaxID=125765 RepID=UPI003A9A5ED5